MEAGKPGDTWEGQENLVGEGAWESQENPVGGRCPGLGRSGESDGEDTGEGQESLPRKVRECQKEERNMAKIYAREELLGRYRAKVQQKQALLFCGVGTGLIARICDSAGVDLMGVYNSGRLRMNGIAAIAGNLPVTDANGMVLEMGERDILPQVKQTPVIAGIFGVDPTRDMERFLHKLQELGFSGVQGFPTVGKIGGQLRAELEQVGLGFQKELSTLKTARNMGMLTMSYCYNVEEARMIADAGIDIIVSHMGLTKGGDVGTREQSPLDVAAERSDEILRAAREGNPEIIPMCHGGSITSPEDAKYVMDHSIAVGFVGASSIERIPTETAVRQVCREYLAIRLR